MANFGSRPAHISALQADFVRRSPHYYVIGATFEEVK